MQTRALYQLLRTNWLEDPSIPVEKWQVEDYRSLAVDELFRRLAPLGIRLKQDAFLAYAENCDTPEELTDCLWTREEESKERDQAYLLIFELWRRLLPEKQSFSLFCNELDHLIEAYDKKTLPDETLLQDALEDLEDVLDAQSDAGESPKEIFGVMALYSAHDLERFIYDYISDQIEAGNEIYGSELLDGFYEFMKTSLWYDFLRARLFSTSNPEEGDTMLRRLLGELAESPDVPLLIEIADYLVTAASPVLFLQAAKQLLAVKAGQQHFEILRELTGEYFRCLDRDQEEKRAKEARDPHSLLKLINDLERSEV